MSWVSWKPCEDDVADAAWQRLRYQAPLALVDLELVEARTSALSFYRDVALLELSLMGPGGPSTIYALDAAGATRWLDGDSAPIHETNSETTLALTDENAGDYVRFFLFFLRANGNAFVLLESPEHLQATTSDPEVEACLASLREQVVPLTADGFDDEGRWRFACTVVQDRQLFRAVFALPADGCIEMEDDEPLGSLEAISAPAYPTLGLMRLPSDREVTEGIVSVLLEEAIAQLDESPTNGTTLLRHFNSDTGADGPLDQFTQMVAASRPVVIIESDIPFVEEFVAGILDGPDDVISGGAIGWAQFVNDEELRCEIPFGNPMTRLQLVSFQTHCGLAAQERTAHELAIGKAAVFIGCDRSSAVPEPLRRITDLTLRFPQIDRRTFARIFERVFQVAPPAGWDASGAAWTDDLIPADFHMPRRLSLDPDDAIRYLRERAEARLRDVTPTFGPKLDELHGLAEARQICEDLIADIHAAQSGEIDWSAVDRGLLLVGPPGTGKTTLARALAMACGIKFVAASAAKWQSAGAMDSHLRAMRADFAEARRYAPAILFIDEIDGIGSREAVDDRNAVYQTGVIDALLEQIQGIDTTDPVIVIGATNYPEKVDPALRRAGRLDQQVQLPLPNVAGLEQIFAHYLRSYGDEGRLAAGVDPHLLAELSLGITGADVEFLVRGAFRRARRAQRRQITQEDLVAEVTHRPRHPESAPRLGPAEMHRVAVHEAGHALAHLLSSSRGEDLTFITIVPRLDGSLGFVASLPRDGYVLTRRTMTERLETILAGRAAEELVFGAEDIGAGAGGSDASSDLGMATRLATLMVCQTGLGDDNALRWTGEPNPAQSQQVDALLAKAYGSILARIEAERTVLDQIAEVLQTKQEMSGAELRALIAAP